MWSRIRPGSAAEQVGEHRGRALVGHDHDIGAGERLEPCGQHVGRRGVRDPEAQLAGMSLGVGDKLRHRPHWYAGRYDQHIRRAREKCHRRETRARIITGALIQSGADRQGRRVSQQKGVTVRFGARHRLGAQGRARAGAVLHKYLSERRRQMLRDQPSHDIHRSARKHGHNELDRPVRIGLRVRPDVAATSAATRIAANNGHAAQRRGALPLSLPRRGVLIRPSRPRAWPSPAISAPPAR